MPGDDDVKRFIQAVKLEADKEEDFVLSRVQENYPTLWNLLESRYKNFPKLCEEALKKASIYGQMVDAVKEIDKQTAHLTIKETKKHRGERIATIVSWRNPELYKKFAWRYSRDEIEKIAVELMDEKNAVKEESIV